MYKERENGNFINGEKQTSPAVSIEQGTCLGSNYGTCLYLFLLYFSIFDKRKEKEILASSWPPFSFPL